MTATDQHVQPTGAVAGYRPERTLRLSVELRRQFKRGHMLAVTYALQDTRTGDLLSDGKRLPNSPTHNCPAISAAPFIW